MPKLELQLNIDTGNYILIKHLASLLAYQTWKMQMIDMSRQGFTVTVEALPLDHLFIFE